MQMHSDEQLKALDPTSPQESRFDANGDIAGGVKAASIARGADAPARSSFRRPRVFAGLAGTAAAATVAVIALTGGSAAVSPSSALAEAANQTAAFSSGVVTTRTVADNAGSKIDATQTIRFDGSNWEVSQHGSTTNPDGQVTANDETIRQVGGKQYSHQNDEPNAEWKVIGDATSGSVGELVGGSALVELVQGADGVTHDGNTYHAMVDGEALKALSTTPFGLDNAAASGPVSVTITVGAGGIQKLTIDTEGVTRITELSDMGAPQAIETPAG